MKLEVGKKYRIEGSDKPWEVVAVDKRGTAWGLLNGVMAYQNFIEIIGEWHDKPNPGEGWRLLHPDEDLEDGDEWWSQSEQTWIPSLQSQTIQNYGWCYRRRIAPKYVPYTWEDREELRGKWYRLKDGTYEHFIDELEFHNDRDFMINGMYAKEFFERHEWIDGSPCGKKVV